MKTCLLILTLFTGSFVYSQSFEEAIHLLNNNKTEEAKKALKHLQKDEKYGPEALLALSMIEANNMHFDTAFYYFQEFYNRSKEPYPHRVPVLYVPDFSIPGFCFPDFV